MRSRRILSGLGSRWPQKGADGELSLASAGRVSAAVGSTKKRRSRNAKGLGLVVSGLIMLIMLILYRGFVERAPAHAAKTKQRGHVEHARGTATCSMVQQP